MQERRLSAAFISEPGLRSIKKVKEDKMATRQTLTAALTACLVLAVLAVLLVASCASPAPAPAKLPAVIAILTKPVGSGDYSITAGLREGIEKKSPMKVRLEPAATDVEDLIPLVRGDSELLFFTGAAMYNAMRGEGVFKDVKPFPARRVWNGFPFRSGPFARGDSGITAIADVKGKKIPQSAGSVAWSDNVRSMLAFGGLSLKDVQVISVSSMSTGVKSVLEGITDMATASPWAPDILQLASSRHGVRWLDLPTSNTEGWKRLREVVPYARPIVGTAGGLKPSETITNSGYERSLWSTPQFSDDMIYAVCKALKESYDIYKPMYEDLAGWTFEQAHSLDGVIGAPYHSGTVKFFKDMGVWTPEHEKYQQEQLALEKQRLGK